MKILNLTYRNSVISYRQFGTGPTIVLCFHGFGEDSSTFDFLERSAAHLFRFYSIDLPFHGNTIWKEGLDFTIQDLKQIIFAITGLRGNDENQVILMGYSLGGRIALSFYESFSGNIKKLVLLAPDGLKINFWYWLATQTWTGNRLFSFTMKHPSWFFGFLKMINKLKLVNASVFKFVKRNIGDPQIRRVLYQRWTTLRNISPHLDRIKSLVNENNTDVRLVYGKHDRIILSSVGERFKKGIEDHCSISMIHSGHQVLHEKHASEIIPALLH
jgi:pimeloyl-ACP methyl ester carboxylesterase